MAASWRVSREFARKFSSYVPPPHAAAGEKRWKFMTLFVAFPSIILAAIKVYLDETQSHHERPPFIKYEHLRIRNKPFPWRDGNKTLFHNPKHNALPDGYEDELE